MNAAEDKVSILLVDDRFENLTALEAVLDGAEYELVKARSGQEALKRLLYRDFALILLDVQMPEMDGFETAAYIRQRERSRQTPIIFVTALNKDERFVFKGYECGAVDYLFKPFEPAILRSKVAVFADLHRKTRQLRESERKLRERQLVELELDSLRRYRNLADAIPNIVWRALPDGRMDYFNKIWLDYTGLTLEQSIGHGWLSQVHPDDAAGLMWAWQKAVRDRDDLDIECRMRGGRQNEYRWHLGRAVAERDAEGNLVGWLGTCTDIHDRKLADEELRAAKEAAERANRAKSEFLANISHEIRTPLGAMLGFAEVMLDPEAREPEHLARCVGTIRRNGKQLLRIIDDILDISKIEAGRLEVERVNLDLTALVNDVMSLLELQAGEKGIRLELDLRGSVPQQVISDPTRLRQILTNVLGNSLKFTETGSVRLAIEAQASPVDASAARLCFWVEDSGCGIDADHQAHLFQPFTQANSTITRKFGGTGLGLALSRRLARSLGGELELVRSELGRGSVFCFALEVEVPAGGRWCDQWPAAGSAPSVPHESAEDLSGLRVLVAEDGADNRTLIRYMLETAGASVETVDNGEDAVTRAEISAPHLVIMDIQMPRLNGYEATRRLRERGFTKPIIALTAYAMKEERDRCLGAGCSDYLTKPVERPALLRTMLVHAAVARQKPDLTAARQRARQMARDLVRGFVAQLPKRVAALRQNWQDGNPDEVQTLAHQLRGAAGGFGFPELTEVAERIEEGVVAGAPPPELGGLIDELERLAGQAAARAEANGEALAARLGGRHA